LGEIETEQVYATIHLLRKIIQSVDEEDDYSEVQICILRSFPWSFCDFCGMKLCMRCGEAGWHPDITCLENLQKELSNMKACVSDGSDPTILSLQWKLTNWYLSVTRAQYKSWFVMIDSKPCPRCFCFILKDEEGCNEMCCNYCGFKVNPYR